jgi:hypothetical protein
MPAALLPNHHLGVHSYRKNNHDIIGGRKVGPTNLRSNGKRSSGGCLKAVKHAQHALTIDFLDQNRGIF